MIDFPKLSDIHAGEQLIADGGFMCLAAGERVTVEEDERGIFVRCAGPDEGDNAEADYGTPGTDARCEHHYLDGQENEAGECVGLYRAEGSAP